jgi:hypothetical protein
MRVGVYIDGYNLYYGGRGGHWWYQLTPADLTSAQLPDPVGRYRKPPGW